MNVRFNCLMYLFVLLFGSSYALSAPIGSIRGMVYDKDYGAPLFEAKITIAETSQSVLTTSEGNYLLSDLPAGNYTLVYSKSGYVRQVKSDIIVNSGQMAEVDIWLEGDYTDMDEFVVQDIQLGGGSESALLELRFEASALMDSIGAELMSLAGASDASDALKLVAGASVQDGKYAVVRGLPDRYVNSQMNGIRLPTADADKRAVQLDQFPAAVIESIQVSKTFTPDQQGDASGGAVNVILKGIPQETTFKFNFGGSYNTNVTGRDDFLSYKGGGVNAFGNKKYDDPYQGDGDAVGVTATDAPLDYKWSVSGGGKKILNEDVTVGAFGSFYYERDSSFYNDGVDDKYWSLSPGSNMSPQFTQGTPQQDEFYTKLFDVTKGVEEVKWGSLGVLGLETENHSIAFVGMYTRTAEDKAVLAEDTRGKEYYFPGYNPYNPYIEGNLKGDAAPYIRAQTLEYTERTTQTFQLRGTHRFSDPDFSISDKVDFLEPELDWNVSYSSADMNKPDTRMFGTAWYGPWYYEGLPEWGIPEQVYPARYSQYKPAADFTLGNVQRIWKTVSEDSQQFAFNLKFPFEQWSESEGYFKLGVFHDKVSREYTQESYSNFSDNSASYNGDWDDSWGWTISREKITRYQQLRSMWTIMVIRRYLPATLWLIFR